MIKLIITIEEQEDGQIRFRGSGEDVGGNPTHLEVAFTTSIMTAIDNAKTGLSKTVDLVPMTIITTVDKEKKDENHNSD